MVRRVRRTGREIGEKRLIGHERLLLADPVDRLRRHVRSEVIALLWGLFRFDRRRAIVQCRIILVGLAAEEAVKIFETAAGGWPGVKRTHGAGLPDWHFVTLAELRGGVA